MPARTNLSPLLRELINANRRAQDPELQAFLTACRLANKRLFWGFDFVEISGLTYEPSPHGQAAAIVPVFDHHDRSLIDLVAFRLGDRRIATRRRSARALGERWIEHAVERQVPLRLYADPVHWLLNDCLGAVILDWTQTRFLLADVKSVTCASRSLAQRVYDTTRRMPHPPRIDFVKRSQHHVA